MPISRRKAQKEANRQFDALIKDYEPVKSADGKTYKLVSKTSGATFSDGDMVGGLAANAGFLANLPLHRQKKMLSEKFTAYVSNPKPVVRSEAISGSATTQIDQKQIKASTTPTLKGTTTTGSSTASTGTQSTSKPINENKPEVQTGVKNFIPKSPFGQTSKRYEDGESPVETNSVHPIVKKESKGIPNYAPYYAQSGVVPISRANIATPTNVKPLPGISGIPNYAPYYAQNARTTNAPTTKVTKKPVAQQQSVQGAIPNYAPYYVANPETVMSRIINTSKRDGGKLAPKIR